MGNSGRRIPNHEGHKGHEERNRFYRDEQDDQDDQDKERNLDFCGQYLQRPGGLFDVG
jgi:hypothetical protein